MSFYLAAPYELPQTVSMFPSPNLQNTRQVDSRVILKESLGSDFRTYVKTSPRVRLSYSFDLDPEKSQELEAFFDAYYDQKIRIIDHTGKTWRGFFVNESLAIVYNRFNNRNSVQLDFKAELING